VNLKEQRELDTKRFQTKLEENQKQKNKLKIVNYNTNKKLVLAIEAIKMSVFSFDLNKEDTENMIQSLQKENQNLRLCLKIQNIFDSRKEIDYILKNEESLVMNRENFIRSQSFQ
jgi:hypothetical protein